MQAASLRQMTAALKSARPLAGGSEGRTGDRVAGSVKAISPSVLAARLRIGPISGPFAESWQGRRATRFVLGRARPICLRAHARRHHIAAMIEPSPFPTADFGARFRQPRPRSGRSIRPQRRGAARRLFARRQRRRRPRRPERGAHRRAQAGPQRGLRLRRHHFLRRSRAHQQPCRPGRANGQSDHARRPRASGARARRRSRHRSCAARGSKPTSRCPRRNSATAPGSSAARSQSRSAIRSASTRR